MILLRKLEQLKNMRFVDRSTLLNLSKYIHDFGSELDLALVWGGHPDINLYFEYKLKERFIKEDSKNISIYQT